MVHLGDGLDLLLHLRRVNAAGLEGGLGVVGDSPVRAAEAAHMLGNFRQALAAIAPVAVIMQRALEISPFNEARDVVRLGSLKLPAILAQFRWHIGQV